jgi:hypothetical protein
MDESMVADYNGTNAGMFHRFSGILWVKRRFKNGNRTGTLSEDFPAGHVGVMTGNSTWSIRPAGGLAAGLDASVDTPEAVTFVGGLEPEVRATGQ